MPFAVCCVLCRSPHPSAPSSHPPSPRGKAYYGKRRLSCSPIDHKNLSVFSRVVEDADPYRVLLNLLFSVRRLLRKFDRFLGSPASQAFPRGEGGPLAVDEENGINDNKRRSPHPSAPSSHPPSPQGKAYYGKRRRSCSSIDCENSIVFSGAPRRSPTKIEGNHRTPSF